MIGCCLKYCDKYFMSMDCENKFNNINQIQKRGLNRTQSGNYFWLPLEKNGELGRNEIIILFCYSFSKYMKEFTNKACHYLCIRGDYAHHWKYDSVSPILPGDPNITTIFNNYDIVQINKDKRYVKNHVWSAIDDDKANTSS